MAPGAAGMPPAAGADHGSPDAVDVTGPLAEYLNGLPARRVLLIRMALHAFEWSPFPWRFSRASLDVRQDFLRRMDESSSWIRQDLLLLLKVLTGSGYADGASGRRSAPTATCRVAPEAAEPKQPTARPLGNLEPLGDGEDCDYAVVGSGAGGAVAATVLAEAGHDVLVLEAGPYLDRRSYPDEPLAALSTLYRDGGLTVAEGLPAIPTPVADARWAAPP